MGTDHPVVKIAMWSGPRNISTAMMRAWENRADTTVVDEPFYASYLNRTGLDHPGRQEVLASQPQDWQSVVETLLADPPGPYTIVYQKHMTHHIDEQMDMDWLAGVKNAFLIREPRRMLASLLRVLPDAGLTDTGLPQQQRLFHEVCRQSGSVPPVVDSDDILRNPGNLLSKLCTRLDVPFDPAMLSWPAGSRPSDGVWAPHWYASVEQSTGFGAARTDHPDIPDDKRAVLESCELIYQELAHYRLQL